MTSLQPLKSSDNCGKAWRVSVCPVSSWPSPKTWGADGVFEERLKMKTCFSPLLIDDDDSHLTLLISARDQTNRALKHTVCLFLYTHCIWHTHSICLSVWLKLLLVSMLWFKDQSHWTSRCPPIDQSDWWMNDWAERRMDGWIGMDTDSRWSRTSSDLTGRVTKSLTDPDWEKQQKTWIKSMKHWSSDISTDQLILFSSFMLLLLFYCPVNKQIFIIHK